MRIASIPVNEELRLEDLYSYDILDSDTEKDFDDLLEVAAQIYGCPMAAITFIDKDRQWLKSKKGIDESIAYTSRDIAFCAHTILESDVMIVKDAFADERFHDNPAVTGNLFIRFYAGAPIVSKAGYKLGAVCVLDNQPRELTAEQARTLNILSQQVSRLLELRLKNKLLKKRAQELLETEKLLLQKSIQESDKERLKISTELHENIAQSLAATKFYLELAEDATSGKDDLIRKSKNHIISLVQQVKDLSASIAPTTLKDTNLKDLLTLLSSHFYNQTGIEAHLVYIGNENLSPEVVIDIYRIVEDQLKNIKKHARATKVVINVNAFQTISVSINDNGVGLDMKKFDMGTGIKRILSRVEGYNGNLYITSDTKGGCQLIATIPVQQSMKAKCLALN